jgi:hypothetical protein
VGVAAPTRSGLLRFLGRFHEVLGKGCFARNGTGQPLNRLEDNKESEVRAQRITHWAGWVAVGGMVAILAATLSPFDFSAQRTAARRTGPFLFWLSPEPRGWFHWFENVLLFMPFGAGLAWWARGNLWRKLPTLIGILVTSCALSFTVEFAQVYLPSRDASWDDVVMNTVGSLLGYLLVALFYPPSTLKP